MFPLLQPDAERCRLSTRPRVIVLRKSLALGSPLWLRDDLVELIGEAQVHSRLIDLVKYATDASPYRMFPKVVVSPRTVEEVKRVFAYAQEKRLPVTIRAAGSSLSGQSQGDGISVGATVLFPSLCLLFSIFKAHRKSIVTENTVVESAQEIRNAETQLSNI